MVNRFSSGATQRIDDLEYRREYGAERAKYELAFAIAEARRDLGLTQQDLATAAGVTQPYIAKLERGDANPTIGHIGGITGAIWLKLLLRFEPLTILGGGTPQIGGPGPSAFEDQITDHALAIVGAGESRIQMSWLYDEQTAGTAVGG